MASTEFLVLFEHLVDEHGHEVPELNRRLTQAFGYPFAEAALVDWLRQLHACYGNHTHTSAHLLCPEGHDHDTAESYEACARRWDAAQGPLTMDDVR